MEHFKPDFKFTAPNLGEIKHPDIHEFAHNAAEQLKRERPELTERVDKYKDVFVGITQIIKKVWDAFKAFTKRLANFLREKFGSNLKNVAKYIEMTEKKKSYKDNLHSFLRTKQHQRNNTFRHSNIYHTSVIK